MHMHRAERINDKIICKMNTDFNTRKIHDKQTNRIQKVEFPNVFKY